MASTPYIQFFLTDVRVAVIGDVAVVTCTENVLTAGTTRGAVVRGRARRWRPTCSCGVDGGWRLWLHHGSPVVESEDRSDRDASEDDGTRGRTGSRSAGIGARGHHGVLRPRAARRAGLRRRPRALARHARRPPPSDDLADTVDYGALAVEVAGGRGRRAGDLIETLAAADRRRCLADPRVECGRGDRAQAAGADRGAVRRRDRRPSIRSRA